MQLYIICFNYSFISHIKAYILASFFPELLQLSSKNGSSKLKFARDVLNLIPLSLIQVRSYSGISSVMLQTDFVTVEQVRFYSGPKVAVINLTGSWLPQQKPFLAKLAKMLGKTSVLLSTTPSNRHSFQLSTASQQRSLVTCLIFKKFVKMV